VLCVSGDLTSEVLLRKIVEVWLETEFNGGRHQSRVEKISIVEQGGDPRELKNNSSQ
jgi:ribose 5-phosphate isomerase B